METLLIPLYKEYNALKSKLDKVSEMIILYGGVIPKGGISFQTFADARPKTTWENRIIEALKNLKKPSTANEISKEIDGWNTEFTSKRIKKAVTLYTSRMGREEKLEVDRSQMANRYSLKQNSSDEI